MRFIAVCFIILAIFVSCHPSRRHTDAVLSRSSFLTDVSNDSLSETEILDRYTPLAAAMSRSEKEIDYFGEDTIENDSIAKHMLLGTLLNDSDVMAIGINLKDSSIRFWQFIDYRWQLVGQEKTNIPVYAINFDDLDGDHKNEIITSTSRNMNGNSWMEVYHTMKNGAIKYAGSFSTEYEVDKEKNQMRETYEGSWYMDESKTIYEWRNDLLVPVKRIILAHDEEKMEKDYKRNAGLLNFEYYENPGDELDGLKLKHKEPYNEDNKKLKNAWDDFYKSGVKYQY